MQKSRFSVTKVIEMHQFANERAVDVEGGDRRLSFAQWTR
jgi:hypothetical protein